MLKLLLMLVMTSQVFTVEVVKPLFTVEVVLPAGTQDGASGSATPARSRKCLTVFVAEWCGPCRTWKSTVYKQLVSAGYVVQLVDIDSVKGFKSIRAGGVPAFVVTDYDSGEFLSEVTHGPISLDAAKWMLDGSGSVVKKQTGEAAKVEQPARFVQWPGWGTIDLETYDRNCDCPMCQTLRVMQRDYRAKKSQQTVSPDQEGTPDDVVSAMLDSMELRPGDVVADLGAGDGRICIAAAKRGHRAIGIEIDSVRAAVARKKVQEAGVAHLVTIEEGDALEFDTTRATAVVTYLYPPLLEKLGPRLKGVRVVASPFHPIPGLEMVQIGKVFVRKGK